MERFLDNDLIIKNDQITFLRQIIEMLDSENKITSDVYCVMEGKLNQMIEAYDCVPNLTWKMS